MKNGSNKPNILLIMADQLAPQFLPCYGHGVVKAPAITKLADEGVVFDAAYTNFPLCAPSRFVMMSGRLPSQISAWDYSPHRDAKREYIRNNMPVYQLEKRGRFPQV